MKVTTGAASVPPVPAATAVLAGAAAAFAVFFFGPILELSPVSVLELGPRPTVLVLGCTTD